jgi:hypothetical protein
MANKTTALIAADPTASIAIANATANAANASISGADARYGSGMFNLTAVASAAGNLTMNLTGPAKVDFRNANLTIGTPSVVSVTGNLNLTVPQGATLGLTANQTSQLVPLLLNNGGNVTMGVVNPVGFNFDESSLLNTSVLNGTSNLAGVVYTASAMNLTPFKAAGVLDINVSVAGNYSSAIKKVQPIGGNVQAGRMMYSQSASIATTSGTFVDSPLIPSWVKEITVGFKGVGTSGTSIKQLQVGNGSPVTSGYVTSMTQFGTSSIATSGNPTGIGIYSNTAADRLHGQIILALENASTNSWTWQGGVSASPSGIGFWTVGGISLSSALDRIRVTTVGGTDSFVAGEIAFILKG